MKKGAEEVEIKLAVESAAGARRLLRGAGFEVSRPRVFEANTVFDTKGRSLRGSGRLWRVRKAGRVVTVTYKGPSKASRHKSREELEVTASDAGTMALMMERIGLEVAFRYEKYRTEFHQPRRSGTAVLDETPIGVYLELEGTSPWIDRTAKRLGFEESDYVTASYGRLYLDWCRKNKRKPGDMVFA